MDSSSSISNGDLASSLVQEIATSLTDQQVPERYIHKNGFTPAEEAIIEELLIDFSRLSSEDELKKLRSALSDYGCFQIVNHGVEKELMEKALEVSKRFFALPLEEKKKSYGPGGIFHGYGNDNVFWGSEAQNWNDRLYLKLGSKDPADIQFFPENPPELREIVRELGDKIQAMPEIIMQAMARSLGLPEDVFVKSHGLDGVFTVKFTFYPRCPNPDHVLGIKPHSDGTTFTMLLQDQEGLQVMANDRWYKVPIIPGALFFNVGDILEIISNGAMKSAMHRVVTSSEKERVSVGMFYSLGSFKEVGPVDELVTTDRPQLYKKTNNIRYGQVYRDWNPKGKRPLLDFRV